MQSYNFCTRDAGKVFISKYIKDPRVRKLNDNSTHYTVHACMDTIIHHLLKGRKQDKTLNISKLPKLSFKVAQNNSIFQILNYVQCNGLAAFKFNMLNNFSSALRARRVEV